jgi:hypothetical protein
VARLDPHHKRFLWQAAASKAAFASLIERLEQGVAGERPYTADIKQGWERIALAAGWRKKGDGHFVSNAGTEVFVNKVAKHPQTGTPLINLNTDTTMIPDLVIVTRKEITVVDHVWKGSERHLNKTKGYVQALENAWSRPRSNHWGDFDIAKKIDFVKLDRLERRLEE